MPPTIHLVVYSGGMDSFTLLHWVKKFRGTHDSLRALSFNYGQRHARELDFARDVCAKMKLLHDVLDLAALYDVAKGSALTDDVPVPHGHYAAESMKATVVPGRNTVMLAMALAYAEGQLNRDKNVIIYYGAHAGDHHIYPDCRPEFIENMARAINFASDGRVALAAPFMRKNKADILRVGLRDLDLAPLDYLNTWTCYEGGTTPCGLCGSCDERRDAFAQNNAVDPWFPAAPATAEPSHS